MGQARLGAGGVTAIPGCPWSPPGHHLCQHILQVVGVSVAVACHTAYIQCRSRHWNSQISLPSFPLEISKMHVDSNGPHLTVLRDS